jgi:hypothetical protein
VPDIATSLQQQFAANCHIFAVEQAQPQAGCLGAEDGKITAAFTVMGA